MTLKSKLPSVAKSVFDRPIAFHRCFVEIAGGVAPALMLSQAYYWSNRTSDPQGWFWKTQEQWEAETGMSATEVLSSRRRLRDTTFWAEELRGSPPKLYFKVDHEALLKELEGSEAVLTLEDCLSNYKNQLMLLSKAGFMRARKAKVEAVYVDYAEVLRSAGMFCYLCGQAILKGVGNRTHHLSFDYVKPLKKGGPHIFENIRPAHAGCNAKNKNFEADQFSYGKKTNSLTVRELKAVSVRELNSITPRELGSLSQREISINTTETTSEITAESTASSSQNEECVILKIVQDAYAEVITESSGYSMIMQLQKEVLKLENQKVNPDQLRRFLAETSLRPVQFVTQNFLIWRENQVRQFEKQHAGSFVGGGDIRAQRVAEIRNGFHLADQPSQSSKPDIDVEKAKLLTFQVNSEQSKEDNQWQAICDAIAKRLNSISFATWFRPLQFLGRSGDVMAVKAPDKVFEEYILNNYKELVEEALAEVGLESVELVFVYPVNMAA